MLRKITAIASLALFAQFAHAAEAGRVIFVAGSVQVVDRPVTEGAAVQEGDMLQTGADGFLYIKTLDNGLFILRPNTKARIVAYHVDNQNPANTRIKLDLISGVARSKSGDAVKHARQNFRFNTPVAAIGVRGTDFTVFTDDNTSRVSVISGGVVVSGFAGGCRPEGSGPCEGVTSRELSATQRGQLLQIKRGSTAPQLISGSVLPQDQPAVPSDAPLGSVSGGGGASIIEATRPNIDAQKTESLEKATAQIPEVTPPVMPPVMPPPVISNPEESLPDRKIVWGRWQPLLGESAKFSLAKAKADADLVAVNGYYALLLTHGKEYTAPLNGTVGFSMRDSEAFVFTEYGAASITAPATLSNGRLNVDFGSKRFTTSLDLTSKSEMFKLQAEGTLTSDGRLFGDSPQSRDGYMNVNGVLSNYLGGTAAYIFDARLDERRTVNGSTYWRRY